MTSSLLQPEPRRDRFGRYLLPDPGEPGATSTLPWTRATTFAKSIADTFGLAKWELRQVAKGLTLRQDLFALAASCSADDKKTLDQVCSDAKEAAASSSGANLGTALHTFTERVDRGEQVNVPPPWDADVTAYGKALDEAGITVLPEYIERIVVVRQFNVAGTLDRVVRLDATGRLYIDDTKTGRNLSYSWTEIAIQLALYAHADAMWNGAAGRYEAMPEVDQDTALVVHLPVGQATAEVHEVDITAGWQAAQLCADVRAWRARKGLSRPLQPKPAKTDIAGSAEATQRLTRASLFNAIKRARSEAELIRIWEQADANGTWNAAATKAAKARKAQLAASQTPAAHG
jgi:hypothetical protein